MKGLAIKEVAERTGIAAATIRVWEQRYGFPEPARTASGYRVYTDEDVEVAAARRARSASDGLSVPAALERARASAGASDRPVDLRGDRQLADDPIPVRRLRKATLLAISRAIEDETLARAAAPVVIGAFQSVRELQAVAHRYDRMARERRRLHRVRRLRRAARARRAPDRGPDHAATTRSATSGRSSSTRPGYAACLLAWETPESQRDDHLPDRDRRFEALWTLDPRVVRRAALVGAALAGRVGRALGARLEQMLLDRPLAFEAPAPGLTALTNRIVGYLD